MTLLRRVRGYVTARRLAQLAVGVEVLVIARTLGEIYRLHAIAAEAFTVEEALAWVTGALIALGFLALTVLFYFFGRHRLAAAAAVAMVAVLIVYKAVAIGLD